MANGLKRVLVTGSSGCIGSATVNWLLENGADEVIGLTRSDAGSLQDRRLCNMKCDVTDANALQGIFDKLHPTHVIHLAALQTPDCRDHPILGLEVNLAGTINLFKACASLTNGLERVVFASSGGVFGPRSMYGVDGVQPDDAYLPHSLYGYWKIAGEGIARAFAQETGIPTVSLRLATTYGPGRDRGYTAAGTRAIKSVALGEPFVIPYAGSEHYHFVGDIGAGFGCAALHPFTGYEAFNLRGETRTVEQFLDLLREAAESCGVGDRFKVNISPDAEKTPFVYDLSSDTAEAAFPQMPLTELEDGLRESLQHYLEAVKRGELLPSDLD